jgi:hypothetical protein
MQKKPSHVKHYLRAKTAESLKALMTKNNVEKQHYFDYQIVHDGVNWFAWFEWDIDSLFSLGDKLDENNIN